LILAGLVLLRSFRLWRTVKRERPITNEEILDLLEDCKMEMGIQTIVGVVVSDRVKSPALFGFIRPRLLLPEGMIERHELEELRYIFIHELGHLRQRDIYLSWLMTLFQVVYWFNPLMWFAIRRIRLEREFACDGLALSTLNADEPPRYGHAIVNLLEKFSQVSYVPSVAGIVEDTSQIERRIKMIAKFKKTSRTRSVGAVLLIAVLACLALTDAYPAEPPFTFGTVTNLGPAVNTVYADCGPSISSDGLTLYFSNAYWNPNPAGLGGGDIWITTRPTLDQPWDPFTNVGAPINTQFNEGTPSISSDGLSLFFCSDRPGGRGLHDLWVSTRPTVDAAWGTPLNLGGIVNSPDLDWTPCISADGLSLFFAAINRPGGMGYGDLWVTRRASLSGPWGPPENLGPNVNSAAYDDTWPCLSPDGLTLLFYSDRAPGHGGGDLWMSTRATTDAEWEPAFNLGPAVNTISNESSPNVSADGRWLFFMSDRAGGAGDHDIWQAEILWEPVCGDEDHPYPTGDLNQDCRVDYADLALLCAHWLEDNNP
jgi:hypothetical protein